MNSRLIQFLLLAAVILVPLSEATACSVCFNGGQTPLGPALTRSIFVLLGLLSGIFACIGWFIFQQVKKSKESPYDFIDSTPTKHAR